MPRRTLRIRYVYPMPKAAGEAVRFALWRYLDVRRAATMSLTAFCVLSLSLPASAVPKIG